LARVVGCAGVDTGGTFTDVVAPDGRCHKVPSLRQDLGRSVAEGLGRLEGRPRLLAHGTTVATNALLERKGAKVALVTNRGLADLIEIGRQARPSLYDPFVDRPQPLVERQLRYEVAGRLDASGAELEPLDPGSLPELDPGVEAVAVCLLHCDLNPAHEEALGQALAGQGLPVFLSSRTWPEFREYERASTTVLNAYLAPACRPYLEGLASLADQVLVLNSAGGLMDLEAALARPVALLLSGPAGGVRAAAGAAAAEGFGDCVSFDMGGTSTDVCLIRQGEPEAAAARQVGGFPVRLPCLDVHTIGAGGGSLARLDPGGALAVGPGSAGAEPGPACYGRGGRLPTVTDADLVLGRIPADVALAGIGRLDRGAALAAHERAGVDPAGVIQVVDTAMVGAIRKVTVERGVDPAGLALVAFGGAGPLHACALAEELGMAAVVVPPRAGVLSAVGAMCSSPSVELARTWPDSASAEGLDAARAELARACREALPGCQVETWLDCRYRGQSHELTVASVGDFAAEHRRRNGYVLPDALVEVVCLRARGRLDPPVAYAELPAPWPPRSGRLVGPVSVAEADCAIWVPPGWTGRVGPGGSWILTRGGGAP
jgi:N-methylhydantoinase A/oxoprolinase/acetone carboxylase beta subunit